MRGKLLIVEDDPMVSQDLQYSLEKLGYDVAGISESAEQAMAVAEIHLPDLALMDINIEGSMDGILTARLLLCSYRIPVIFLTSHSDERTICRAAQANPYGYLVKPPSREDLKAALLVAFHRIEAEAADKAEQWQVASAISTIHEGILTVSLDGRIQFMNAAAEKLTGMLPVQARGRQLSEVIRLRTDLNKIESGFRSTEKEFHLEEMGWTLKGSNRSALLVSVSVAPMLGNDGDLNGYVLTLRNAVDRLRERTIAVCPNSTPGFESAPVAMVELDESRQVVRVNDVLVRESGVDASRLVGRSLTELSLDSDQRISETLVSRLLGLPGAAA